MRLAALVLLLIRPALAFGKGGRGTREPEFRPDLVVQTGHSLPVVAVALSRDGKLAATGSRDGTAILWEAATGFKLREIKAERLGVTAVALSPDGRRLLTGGAGTAHLWDAQTGALVREFGQPGEFLSTVLFTPDGAAVLTAGDDGTAKLWDLATGRRRRQFGEGQARVAAAALSRDGRRLALVSGGDDAWVWDTASGALVQQFVGAGPWTAAAFSADGRLLVTGSRDSIRVWDVARGVDRLSFKSSSAGAVAMTPNGRLILSCGGANTARLWDAGSGEPARSLIGHFDKVGALALGADGALVLTGSDDHTARLWDAATGRPLRVLGGARLPVLFAAVSNDGRRLVTVDPQKAELWDLERGSPVGVSTGEWESAAHFAASADGRWLASLKDRELVDLKDLSSARDAGGFRWNLLKASALAVEPGGRFLVTARDESLQAWGIPDGQERPLIGGHREDAGWLGVGLDGRRLVVRGLDGAVELWDLDGARRIARFKLETASLPDVVISRDGRWVAAGASRPNGRYVLSVRGLRDGEELKSWETEQTIMPLAFGPAGDSLLVLSGGGAWEWDLPTGRKKRGFQPPAGASLDWPEAVDPDWRYALARREDALSAVSLDTGKQLGRLELSDKGWLVEAADGRRDASPDAVRWTVGLKSFPLRRFAGDSFVPGLLGLLLRGEP